MAGIYDFDYHPSNVYGHVVALLQKYDVRGPDGVHLDIGCGYGRIAEHLVAATGLTYVGVDGSEDGLASLQHRGFEAHQIAFGACDSLAALKRVLAGRELRSISCIDMLEHVLDPKEILKELRELADGRIVPLITSVPNVAHSDVAIKLIFGRFDPSDAGILDRTHITHFTDRVFGELLSETGWQQVLANDVPVFRSDQRWPIDHLGFSRGALLSRQLRLIRAHADPFASTNQFVRLSLPRAAHYDEAPEPLPKQCFLTIIIASDGSNIDSIRDILTCLSAQTDFDFEFFLVGYDIDYPRHIELLEAIEWYDASIRERGLFIPSHASDHVEALNIALSHATGRYIAIVDDYSTLCRNWVESFHKLATENPGKIIALSHRGFKTLQFHSTLFNRSLSVSDAVVEAEVEPRLPDFFDAIWNEGFPPATIAFPFSLVRDQSFHFDPKLPNGHHWDLAVRGAALCGVKMSKNACVNVRDRAALQNTEIKRMHANFETTVFLLPGEELKSLYTQKTGTLQSVNLAEQAKRPFLSVLAAVEPAAPPYLLDLVSCLANQTDRQFELISVLFNCTEDEFARTSSALRGFPRDVYSQIKLYHTASANEATAINIALSVARGDYFSVARNDALPASNWIASFRNLASGQPDTALYVACKNSESGATAKQGNPVDILQQIAADIGPSMAYAFPRAAVANLGIAFDENLKRTFLWDFRVRFLLKTKSPRMQDIPAVVLLGSTEHPETDEETRLQAGFAQLTIPFPLGTIQRIDVLESENVALELRVEKADEEIRLLKNTLNNLGQPKGIKKIFKKLGVH